MADKQPMTNRQAANAIGNFLRPFISLGAVQEALQKAATIEEDAVGLERRIQEQRKHIAQLEQDYQNRVADLQAQYVQVQGEHQVRIDALSKQFDESDTIYKRKRMEQEGALRDWTVKVDDADKRLVKRQQQWASEEADRDRDHAERIAKERDEEAQIQERIANLRAELRKVVASYSGEPESAAPPSEKRHVVQRS